jgi:hypothetical protein
MSITTTARQAQGMRVGEVIAKLAKDAYFMRVDNRVTQVLSYGPPWAHYLGGYQDRLLSGPLGLPGLRYTAPDGVEHKDYGGEVLG